jgi:hypothetical protein
MKIKARRGVCIGVDRNLKPGDLADLDLVTVEFLEGIGAVERVPDAPIPDAPIPDAPIPDAPIPVHTPASVHAPTTTETGRSVKKEK